MCVSAQADAGVVSLQQVRNAGQIADIQVSRGLTKVRVNHSSSICMIVVSTRNLKPSTLRRRILFLNVIKERWKSKASATVCASEIRYIDRYMHTR